MSITRGLALILLGTGPADSVGSVILSLPTGDGPAHRERAILLIFYPALDVSLASSLGHLLERLLKLRRQVSVRGVSYRVPGVGRRAHSLWSCHLIWSVKLLRLCLISRVGFHHG